MVLMKKHSLKTQILFAFFLIIFIEGSLSAVLGFYVIKNKIVVRAHKAVARAIGAAEGFYEGELNSIKIALNIIGAAGSLDKVKETLDLDYAYEVDSKNKTNSEIVKKAFSDKAGVGGTRIIDVKELQGISPYLPEKLKITTQWTPKAKPSSRQSVDSVIAMEYAMPVLDKNGSVSAVRYAGKILNKDFRLVDKINNLVFEREIYKSKPVATVTVFQDDIRVATNVLDKNGKRAIGTRVSGEVYDKVLVKGDYWIDRAFVVTDWYFTAYRPIKDISGNIIGMLYVGMLEKPFVDFQIAFFSGFLGVIVLSGILALFFSYFLAYRISSPVINLLNATKNISEGDLSCRVSKETKTSEFNELVQSFNTMAEKLDERDKSLKVSREKIETLNKMYLDLISFVSHELKGILSSIVLNVYSLQNAILGPVNEAQSKTLKSIGRNLDYLSQTVKNFLNLSRVEKGEMRLNKKEILLKENVFDISNESFLHLAQEKHMEIENNIEPGLRVVADMDLMHVVANNLVSNAIKYGEPGSKVIISSKKSNNEVEIEVYNEGRPITQEDIDKLFKKFSRIIYSDMEKVKGTGIGLFITKEIIERHGGSIWANPREHGNAFKFKMPLG